ncbi:hypothetical protein IB254_25455 [Pseudomonas sp. PDM03]|uniref:DUF4435 domain-containing protein n=1 Tax=Pseudomonas sp. PDM03 TaxID=2769266 RepID=UPI0017876D21|nr:DUF4435 domain-containing protein [Pseudomonas sp. PDM03]MBD9590434.1 hypothetical protein [Pseudomonas sp. PDM03]
MEQHITPERIANSLMQDTRFKGTHVLVEGIKDLKVYTKFFNREEVRLTQTTGKYKLREAYGILSSRGFTRKIAIRDADFLRIKGNIKFDQDFKDDIFVTDGHDSEVMMIMVDTLEDLLSVGVDQQIQRAFEEKANSTIKKVVLDLAYLTGCLRLADKKENLGLSFKPASPDGNRIRFKKFICEKTFSLNIDQMIHIVWEYSKNRQKVVSTKQVIRAAFDKILLQENNYEDMINGHDVAEIVCIIASVALKSKSNIFQHPDRVEESLALSFDRGKFRKTNLFQNINRWQGERNLVGLFSD